MLAQPGDVLVLDEGEGNVTGSFGHNMSLQARNRGVVGVVSSGCIREYACSAEKDFRSSAEGLVLGPHRRTPRVQSTCPFKSGGLWSVQET